MTAKYFSRFVYFLRLTFGSLRFDSAYHHTIGADRPQTSAFKLVRARAFFKAVRRNLRLARRVDDCKVLLTLSKVAEHETIASVGEVVEIDFGEFRLNDSPCAPE